MMSGEGIADEQQFEILRQRYPDRDKSEREIRDIIEGAHKRDFKPATTSQRPLQYRRSSSSLEVSGNKVTFKLSGEPAGDVPPGRELKPIDFLRLAFKPGELICLNNETAERAGKETITGHGHFRTIEEWGEKFTEFGDDMLDGSVGCWVRINPFKESPSDEHEGDNKPKGDDKHVADFRNLLVEFDSRPLLEQWRIYKESGLPIRFVIDSGGDSLHAWIAVDAASAEEFKARQERVYDYLSDYLDDKGNKNPSRFSRLPGVLRKEKGAYQTLVAENIGATGWQEWELRNTPDTTEWFSLDYLLNFDRENDPACLMGNRWVCEGGSLLFQGYSGIGKSSLMMQKAVYDAVGRDFFGIKITRPLKVVFIQAENDGGDLAEVFQDVYATLSTDERELLRHNFIIGRESECAGAEAFGSYVRQKVKQHMPDILYFDPLLSYFGDDIIKQQAVSMFFRNTLQPIQNETGVVVVFAHHLGKPSQNQQQRQGPAHYQGLGSSDIVNWAREMITITETGEGTGTFRLEFGKRGRRTGIGNELYLKHAATGVCWELADDIKSPQDAKTAQENKRRAKLEEFVRSFEMVTLQQMKENAKAFGYGENSIKTALDALSQNSVDSENPIYCYRAHVNGADANSTVYSVQPKPEDGHVKSRDIKAADFTVRLNGVDVPF